MIDILTIQGAHLPRASMLTLVRPQSSFSNASFTFTTSRSMPRKKLFSVLPMMEKQLQVRAVGALKQWRAGFNGQGSLLDFYPFERSKQPTESETIETFEASNRMRAAPGCPSHSRSRTQKTLWVSASLRHSFLAPRQRADRRAYIFPCKASLL